MAGPHEPIQPGAGDRRILMIACAFPPTGGPGVQRSVKFAKYLPQFGWQPTVWAADPIDGLPRDPTLLSDLPPELTIHRQGRRSLIPFVRRPLRALARGNGIASKFIRSVDWRFDRAARDGPFTPMPDEFVSWAKASVRPLLRMIDEKHINVIYSTFSPASNHLLGLALKRRTGLPWVADFRDLWTQDYRYRETSRARHKALRRLEQDILEVADIVVGVTTSQTEILARYVPGMERKFVTITNGFDPVDFRPEDVQRRRGSARFVLAHVGRFDRWRTSEAWYLGLQRFLSSLSAGADSFELRIIGHAAAEVHERLERTGVPFVYTGYVCHDEAVREMRLADALLLCVPAGLNGESVIPAKLFEYLAAQRPILVVGPPGGESERIVRQCEAGVAVNLDERTIAEALRRLHESWRAGTPIRGCREDRLQMFSRVELTRSLTSVLDQLVASRTQEHGVDLSMELVGAR